MQHVIVVGQVLGAGPGALAVSHGNTRSSSDRWIPSADPALQPAVAG